MPNDFKQNTINREESIKLKVLPPTIIKKCFTGWNIYRIYLALVVIRRNKKFIQFEEVLYKERNKDIHIDEDLNKGIKKTFDIGKNEVYEIKEFHKIKSLGNGAKD